MNCSGRFCLVAWLLLCASAAAAGQVGAPAGGPGSPTAAGLPAGYAGPPAPVPPEVINRDASGRVTVRAVRVTAPLQIDGRLDEAIFSIVPPMAGFVQTEPVAGAPATEKTEVWVLFDNNYVYVIGRCWESHPERMVANEMRRDSTNIAQNENFSWSFDTFYDRRSGFMFQTNPLGGRMDGQTTNQDSTNFDWNPVWELAAGRFDGGWIIEAAIPFKSLRYRPGEAQVWGFQVRRRNLWKNEISYLSPIPAEIGVRGLRPSMSATLVGLEVPPASRNLEVKPYVIADLTSDTTARPPISNHGSADAGVDVKYGVTENLTADFTYNTDFAQVEADEQQVNLTRFNLQLPEKREFFLENRGTFALAGEGGGDTPILFYSRRVGLNNEGRETPIRAGGRLTGRVGQFNVGVLNVQTDEEPVSRSKPTNFSVMRLKRDVLRRSSIGALFTGRSVASRGTGSNLAYGADGNFVFRDKLTINSYWARTRTDGLSGQDTSYRANLDYSGDRYGLQAERLVVGDNFNPEVGFVRRDNIRRSFGLARFSPRPKSIEAVRKFSGTGSIAYIENGAGRLETREANGDFGIEFQNSDQLGVGYGSTYEFLPKPFAIAPGVTLPVGGYDFATARASYTFGQHRPASGRVLAEYGTFYSGHRAALTVSAGRVKLTPQFSAQPSYSMNRVDLVEGSFTTHLVGSRVTYTMTPAMFASALLQYNSTNHSVAANVRLRWEYRPGSELFIVLNEQRDTSSVGRFPDLTNRAIIVKINRLLRF